MSTLRVFFVVVGALSALAALLRHDLARGEAEAATSTAYALYAYHTAAVAYKRANLPVTGSLPALTNRNATAAAQIVAFSCADGRSVLTVAADLGRRPSQATLMRALKAQSSAQPDLAMTGAGNTATTVDGRAIAALPCPAPAGRAALLTQVHP